jgi:hypothetical protein
METSRERETAPDRPGEPGAVGYEAPSVERVLTPADLEREILYAGQDGQSNTDQS